MCLDDPGSATTSGTALDIATCSGGANQIWPLPSAPGPAAGAPSGPIFPQLLSTDSQQPCLDDANDSTAAGNKIQLWTCRGDAAQNWLVEPGGTIQLGAVVLPGHHRRQHAIGTKVVLEPCNGGSEPDLDARVERFARPAVHRDVPGHQRRHRHQRHRHADLDLQRRHQPGLAPARLVTAMWPEVNRCYAGCSYVCHQTRLIVHDQLRWHVSAPMLLGAVPHRRAPSVRRVADGLAARIGIF